MTHDTLNVNVEHMQAKELLQAASDAVQKQLAEHPALGIPVDPDVAENLGAFEEPALDFDDLDSAEEFAANLEGTHE